MWAAIKEKISKLRSIIFTKKRQIMKPNCPWQYPSGLASSGRKRQKVSMKVILKLTETYNKNSIKKTDCCCQSNLKLISKTCLKIKITYTIISEANSKDPTEKRSLFCIENNNNTHLIFAITVVWFASIAFVHGLVRMFKFTSLDFKATE